MVLKNLKEPKRSLLITFLTIEIRDIKQHFQIMKFV